MTLDFTASIREGITDGLGRTKQVEALKAELYAAKTELLREVQDGLGQLSALVKPDSPFGPIEFSAPEPITYSVDKYSGYHDDDPVELPEGLDFSDEEPGDPKTGIQPAKKERTPDPLPREITTNMCVNQPEGWHPPTEGIRIEVRSDELSIRPYNGVGRKDTQPLASVELTEPELLSTPTRQEKVGEFIKGIAKIAAQNGYNFAD